MFSDTKTYKMKRLNEANIRLKEWVCFWRGKKDMQANRILARRENLLTKGRYKYCRTKAERRNGGRLIYLFATHEKNITCFPMGYGPPTIILKSEISFIKRFFVKRTSPPTISLKILNVSDARFTGANELNMFRT